MSNSSNLQGRFELGIVDSLNTTTRRGVVRSIETGGTQSCIFNPSPYGGHVPGVGALVAVYMKKGYYAKYLFTVSEIVDDEELSASDRIQNGEEPLGVSPDLDIGDTFIGRHGRVLADDQGNVTMYTRSTGQQLTLSESNSNANLTAWNYKLQTPGGGIAIATSSSIPSTFGDSITISKNVPIPLLPEELLSTPTFLTNISSIGIDALGGIKLSSLAGLAVLKLSAPIVPLGPDVPGRIVLENASSGLTMEASGETKIANLLASMSLGITGNISLFAPIGSISLTSIGKTVDITGVAINLNALSTTLSGNTTVQGILQVDGLSSFLGPVSFVGIPAVVPLASKTTIALVPIFVNGTLVGNIPVIA